MLQDNEMTECHKTSQHPKMIQIREIKEKLVKDFKNMKKEFTEENRS